MQGLKVSMHLSLIQSDGDEAKCGCFDKQISKAHKSDCNGFNA